MDNVFTLAKWADEYIKEYQKSGDFDPYAALTGTEDRKQKIFLECVSYLYDLEKLAEDFRKTRDKITFGN